MSARTAAPAGAWRSRVTSKLVTVKALMLGAPVARAGSVWWVEGRPAEGGRQAIVRDGVDVVGAPWNARTRVHEYGGGELLVSADGASCWFSSFADQRLYRMRHDDAEPTAVTADSGGAARFADGALDEARRLIFCVREDHSAGASGGGAVNEIVAVGAESGDVSVVASGEDFYAAPRVSPCGTKLAYISWRFPNMPWDDTTLWVQLLDADGGAAGAAIKVAGGDGADVAVLQPLWSPGAGADGAGSELFFCSDESDFWAIHRAAEPLGSGSAPVVQAPMQREFAAPLWRLGQRSYQFTSSGLILAKSSAPEEAGSELSLICPTTGAIQAVPTPFGGISSDISLDAESGVLAFVGASAASPSELVSCAGFSPKSFLNVGESIGEKERFEVLRRASQVDTAELGSLSAPQKLEFATANGQTAWMYFYPPASAEFKLLEGELPPLLVKSHGGPTGATSGDFSLSIQFWTSRGFAVADVDYGGSSGYGREYRKRLEGAWGVVDVDDCCSAATNLVAEGRVDGKRLCIDGGSAGGYTTLSCLAFRDVFSAGASMYGIGDLLALAGETHKFESRYLDFCLGPLVGCSAEEKAKTLALMDSRSPIKHLDKFNAPLILFQGDEDVVVPPAQAEMMFEAVKAKGGLKCALVMFEGEQHGFRKEENIRRTLDGELDFFSKAFGFDAAEMPEDYVPVSICE